jgi:hypothetical protein
MPSDYTQFMRGSDIGWARRCATPSNRALNSAISALNVVILLAV